MNTYFQRYFLVNVSKCLSYFLLLLLLFLSHCAFAQLPTLAMVDQQVSIVDKETDPASLEKLQKIKDTLQLIDELQQQNLHLKTLLEKAPQRKNALQEKLQKAAQEQPEGVQKSALVSDVELSLATEKARSKEWATQLAELKKQQQTLFDAQDTLPLAIAEQEQIVAKLAKDNLLIPDTADSKIDKWFTTTEQLLQTTKLQGLVLQQDTLILRRELAKMDGQILEYQLALTNKQIELLQVRLLEVSAQSTLKVIEQAKQLSRALLDAPDYIQQWNVKNEALAVEFEALNRQLLLTKQERQQLEEQRQRVSQNLAQIKGNIKWLKNSPAFSDAISVQLQLLSELSDKSDLAHAITSAHLRHFQLSAELEQLKDIPGLIKQIGESATLNALHEKALTSILNFRHEVLTDAFEKTDQFIAEVTRLDVLQDQFHQEIQAERDFLREKRLFIRDRASLWSLPLLDLNTWLGTPSLLQRVTKLVSNSVTHSGELFLLGMFFVLVAGVILQLKKTEKTHRLAYVKLIGRVRKDNFLATFILFLLAIVCGVLLASCLWVIEYWIKLRLGSFYSYDLNNIFTSFSLLILVWESLIRMAMADGLFEAHLGWSKTVVKWLKSSLSKQRWILYTLLLSILLSEILTENTDSLLLRTSFIILLLWFIVFTFLLFKRQHLPVLLPKILQSPGVLQLLRIILILPLIAITTLAIWGYFYTSWVMLFYYYAILLCLLIATLLQQLGVRWLQIEQRRISLQRALEKREEQQQRDKGSLVLDEIDESVIPVEDIGEQSLTLLNLAVLVFLFVILSTLLSDSLLTLHWMNDVTIWDVLTETESGTIVESISLQSLLSALISLGLSFFLAKNIPGLLELLLLHRLDISTGATYAMNTLLRYAIVLSGFLIAVSTLGFHWSRLQWLVAALSVGLGFGLQEIFANLVSGIILLFERPVRVGDTITIQNLSGVVTRINTRATTILDWDQKEIVVPNKSLITEQLVNWSLSDATTRIIILVGVAYGSDVQLVKKLLLQAADECEGVSKTPEPLALFLLFGGSSLDFELRVFLPKLEGRSLIKDKLNTAIDRLFRLNNVEIPFPQMDIHVRDLPVKDEK